MSDDDTIYGTLEGRVRAIAAAAYHSADSSKPLGKVYEWARLNGLRISVVPVEDMARLQSSALLASELEWWPPE